MGGWQAALLVVAAVALAVVGLLARGRAVAPRQVGDGSGRVATADPIGRVRTRTMACRLAGLFAGLLAAAALVSGPAELLGLGAALAPTAFALCLLVGVIVGELAGRAPGGVTRVAMVEIRSVAAFLPGRLLTSVAVTASTLALFLVATTIVGSPDDLGRAGRALSIQCSSAMGSTVGPWPGAFYAGPIAAAVLIGLVLAVLASRIVARRPRPRTDEPGRTADDQLRRASGRAITSATGVLVAAPLAGSALFAGHALLTVGCGPVAVRFAGLAASVLAVAAVLASAAFVATVLLPADR